jgi:hypothetical protein
MMSPALQTSGTLNIGHDEPFSFSKRERDRRSEGGATLIQTARLDYTQRRLAACFGRKRRRLIWGNKTGRLQQTPNLRSYEISNPNGGKIPCQ